MSISFFRRTALVGAIAALTACGGGGGGSDSNSGSPTGPATPSQTGVFTDSAVGGVTYTTSSGYTGTTDSTGHFRYNINDTVTFKIGEVTLGAVTPTVAEAIFTPIELATTNGVVNTDKVTNLLVLLQSLDSDHKPDNGITVPTAANTALSSTAAENIKNALAGAPTAFAASGLQSVVNQVNNNVPTPLVTAEAAAAHFNSSFFSKLAGTWALQLTQGFIYFRFDANGNYIMSEIAPVEGGGHPGIERGQISWSSTSGEITTVPNSITVDTNGEWGLSNPGDERLYFAIEGDNTLVVTIKVEGQPDQVMRWSRTQPGSGIVGTWVVGDGTSFDSQQFVFFGAGTYLMLDPLGDLESATPQPGLEFGSYTFNAGHLSTSAIQLDTNGGAGLHDGMGTPSPSDDIYGSADATLGSDGNTLVVQDEGGPVTLYRPVVTPPAP
jgi:hypothetical protein